MKAISENNKTAPARLGGLTLAFVGDAVFELLVREYLASQPECSQGQLHKKAVEFVRAGAQSASAEKLLGVLTQQELDVFKRGRNAHTSHIPKGATSADYHAATAVEALFGYLYLNGETDRINELFRIVVS